MESDNVFILSPPSLLTTVLIDLIMRRRSFKLALIFLFRAACPRLQAQDTLMQHYAREISEAVLKENLTILASDFMDGRETGKRGQRMAASFIRAHFSDNKLLAPVAGDYLQPLEFYSV